VSDALVKALLPLTLVAPPAPREYAPTQMIGRQEESVDPGFLKEMSPMLIAGLADLLSTELFRMSSPTAHEDNPLVRKLQLKGSNAPVMSMGTLLQALLYHEIGKKKPKLGEILKSQQTATSGTLAGQNFSMVGQGLDRDPRLSVWAGSR